MHHHQLAGSKLSRERDQRRALLRSLATSLVMQEKITTTKPKAKAVQPFIEKLISKAKAGGVHQRRQVAAEISAENAVSKLFEDLAKRFAKRAGGYTRVQPAGWRRGDNAELATISFTEKAASVAKPEAKEAAKAASKTPEKPKVKEAANAKA